MRARMAATCLTLEAFLALFAGIGIRPTHPEHTIEWAGWFPIAILAIIAAGTCRKPHGIWLGWTTQAAIIALGFTNPWALGMGMVFVALWVWLLGVGAKIDRERAIIDAQFEAKQATD